jgi:hypothetical protein
MMESNEKQVSEQSNDFPCECVPAPASIEQAYELGWRWRRESFVGLDQMRESLSVITKREGLAHFVSEVGNEGIIIPFAATYDFGAPRYPKYPYAGAPSMRTCEPTRCFIGIICGSSRRRLPLRRQVFRQRGGRRGVRTER